MVMGMSSKLHTRISNETNRLACEDELGGAKVDDRILDYFA